MVLVVYSLMNGARYGGIDNAAHIGGLVAGFVMGLVLARPLSVDRNSRQWTGQCTVAIGIVGCATALFAYLTSTGSLGPRLARDSNGKPIPLEGLAAPIQSLGGYRLGMTPDQLLSEKGQPIHRTDTQWDYNSIDARHDGVLSVQFSRQGQSNTGPIGVIEFFGNRESAPSQIPYLSGLSTADVIRKYGDPAGRVPMADGTTFLWFRNGIMVGTKSNKIYRYGIFDYRLVGNR
jgi:hypothetical protein